MRAAVAALAACAALLAAGASPALASHGGGGGGGGGTPPPPPPPTGTPAVSLTPSTVTYAAQEVATSSAAQTVTLTNTGTASLFINGMSQGGLNPLDFAEVNDQCVGTSVAAGASCTLSVIFKPTATGTRSATISVLDNAQNSPQVITFTGTGTSAAGPTPLAVDTGGMTCTAGVCDVPGTIVTDFSFASFGAVGDTAPPFTWSLAGGALPPGLTLFSDGKLYGTATTTGTFTFTLRVTDPRGQTATQAFRQTIAPLPAAGDPACQHAPSSSNATLTGPAIGGRTPSGQALGDQSKLTACGGFVTITVSVNNVNLPNGTVLWVKLTTGPVIGLLTINNGSATMKPYVLNSDLRKKGISIYNHPPPVALGETALLAGPFF